MATQKPWTRGIARVLVISALTLSLRGILAAPAQGAQPGSLPALEAQVATSPALRAEQLAIQAAADDVRATRDKTGLAYTYINEFGPEAIIVPYDVDDHVLRFEQEAGIRLPILGTHTAQLLTIVDAERREQIAQIAMNTAYRERLADLREAYVRYWSDQRDIETASTYLTSANDERPQALSLLRRGFWTQTEFMDYATTVSSVNAQENEARDDAAVQLAQISSSLGHPVDAFDATPPQFFDGCMPDRVLALASAYDVDASLAQLQAEREVVETQLGFVKNSGIDAAVQAHAGTQTDINHQVSGYDLLGGVEFYLPSHVRDEERAERAKFQTQLQQIALQTEQRKAEIDASVDASIAEIGVDDETLSNARAVQQERERDFRTALSRFNTLKEAPQQAFADVHAKMDELYVTNRAVAAAESSRLLKAKELLKVAPGACGAAYDKIEPFFPQITVPSRKSTTGSPSPQSH